MFLSEAKKKHHRFKDNDLQYTMNTKLLYTGAAFGFLYSLYMGALLYVMTDTFVTSFGEDFRIMINGINDLFIKTESNTILLERLLRDNCE